MISCIINEFAQKLHICKLNENEKRYWHAVFAKCCSLTSSWQTPHQWKPSFLPGKPLKMHKIWKNVFFSMSTHTKVWFKPRTRIYGAISKNRPRIAHSYFKTEWKTKFDNAVHDIESRLTIVVLFWSWRQNVTPPFWPLFCLRMTMQRQIMITLQCQRQLTERRQIIPSLSHFFLLLPVRLAVPSNNLDYKSQ